MGNLTDYINWRGDLSFEERAFQIVDSMVLCHLAYLPAPIEKKSDDARTVRDWINQYALQGAGADIGDREEGRAFAVACMTSRRFGQIMLTDWQECFDAAEDIQFGAFTFELPGEQFYIAFRGTDNSITGWKEDFMLSFTRIPSQDLALSYVQKQLRLHPDGQFFLGGHSKGANLALYAAACLEDAEQVLIKQIYLNDGPGICPEILGGSRLARIKERCISCVPEYDVIGHIFSPDAAERHIIRSSGEGIMQHVLLTWQVTRDGVCEAPSNAPGSEWLNQVLDQWLEGASIEERRRFTDTLFDAMRKNGAETMAEFAREGPYALERLLTELVGRDGHLRRTVLALPERFLFGDHAKRLMSSKTAGRLRSSEAGKNLLMIAAGVLFLLIPEHLMQSAAMVTITTVALFEVWVTFRELKKVSWDLTRERVRIRASIILLALCSVAAVKENALFLIASILFSVFFFLLAYRRFMEALAVHDARMRGWHIGEGVCAAILGGFIMVAPQEATHWYMVSCGGYLILDGALRLILSAVGRGISDDPA